MAKFLKKSRSSARRRIVGAAFCQDPRQTQLPASGRRFLQTYEAYRREKIKLKPSDDKPSEMEEFWVRKYWDDHPEFQHEFLEKLRSD